jgi:hypothetical protein
MTPATSVSFYKPVFSDFLYAQVDEGWNGNPLSVLSALTRLNVDPWMEAAELAELPEESARRRLAELLERLPSRPWARTESGSIADRLLKLLPHSSPSEAPPTQLGHGILHVTFTPQLKMVIFLAAIGVYAFALIAHRESLSRSDMSAVPAGTASQSLIP